MKSKLSIFLIVGLSVLSLFLTPNVLKSQEQLQKQQTERYFPVDFDQTSGEFEVYLNGYLTEENTNKLFAELYKVINFVNKIGVRPVKAIKVFINSKGGDMQGALSIRQVLKEAQKVGIPVETFARGYADSAASIILAAGTKGKRYVSNYTTMMFHDPQMIYRNVEIDKQMLDRLQEEYEQNTMPFYEALAEDTGKTVKQIRKESYKGKYMIAKQIVQFGLADDIK